jgi:hypothetical protein
MSDVAAYNVLFLVQGGMWTAVHWLASPHTSLQWKQSTHKYTICRHVDHNNEILIILTRNFNKEQYVLPEDDTRYAIETCRSILSVLV